MKPLHGLSSINLELTSRCNKFCWMCGRRKVEGDYGDMDFSLVEKIAKQLPPKIVVQFHNNGDPLMYPRLGEAIRLFKGNLRCLDTNGKLLVEKANEIVRNLHTIAISVIENDPEGDEQYEIVKEFLKIRGDDTPSVIFRLLGDVDDERWKGLRGIIARRTLHSPMGSFKYKTPRVVPEIGVCLELLHHLSIDRFGNVSPCVRFDPKGIGIIGNANNEDLETIWARTPKRTPLCDTCDYWGIPS